MNLFQIFGEHSNIPQCCIDYFCGPWKDIYATEEGQKYINERPNGVHYIPCPMCRKNDTYVETHHCDINCWDFMRQHGLSKEQTFEVIINNVLIGRVPISNEIEEYMQVYITNRGAYDFR